jgi:hypothetical protein
MMISIASDSLALCYSFETMSDYSAIVTRYIASSFISESGLLNGLIDLTVCYYSEMFYSFTDLFEVIFDRLADYLKKV